jgi:hypothetical protein
MLCGHLMRKRNKNIPSITHSPWNWSFWAIARISLHKGRKKSLINHDALWISARYHTKYILENLKRGLIFSIYES